MCDLVIKVTFALSLCSPLSYSFFLSLSSPFLSCQPNGNDVYKGVSKDYTGAQVTPANFLKVSCSFQLFPYSTCSSICISSRPPCLFRVVLARALQVLKGQAEEMKGVGSGKVLQSGPNDNVFVFFSDHGANSDSCRGRSH